MTVLSNLLAPNVSGMETDISGWTAGANTTLSWSTRFFSGAHSLQMTATAAGSATASTVNRVAVEAGTEIMAYAYFAGVTATTGRTTTVSVSFYAAATGGTAISTVTSTASSLPNSTAWVTPPPNIITTVPAGAAYATVTITASGLAAGGAVVADDVAIGLGNVIAGNLLSYAAQGMEMDASRWTAVSGATITTSSAHSWEGYRSLQITSTSAGDAVVRGLETPAVTPGVEYFAYGYIMAPAASMSWIMQIDWLDGTGTTISSSAHTWADMPTSLTARFGVIGTAPAGAATARVVLRPQSTASGQVWFIDQIAMRVAPVVDGGLVGYGAQSIEVDVSGWSAVSNCTVSRSLVRAWEGAASMAVAGTGGDATITLATPIPVEPRQAYRFQVATWLDFGPRIDAFWNWLDADGAVLLSTSVQWYASDTPAWYAPIASGVAPDGAVAGVPGLTVLGMTAGQIMWFDQASVTANGLGVVADLLPGLYGVRVSVQGLTTDSPTTWSLWRMGPDGSLVPIRSVTGETTDQTVADDTATVDDFEAPLGAPIQYLVQVAVDGASKASSTSNTVTIDDLTGSRILLRDPTLPARWTTATVETLPDWQRTARQGVNPVRGRANPIVISDVRNSRQGQITVTTEDADERDELWWVLTTGDALLMQWPPGWHEPDLYVTVGDVTETHLSPHAAYADRGFQLALTEVDRPTGPLTGSPDRTWQDIADDYGTWFDVLSAYTSWLGVLTGLEGS